MANCTEIQRKTVPFQYKAAGDETGRFSGICSVFNNVDSCREIIAPGAFADCIAYFLSDGFIAYQHEWEEPIGKPLSAKEASEGLFITGEIYPEMFEAASVLAGMRRGIIKQMSIGYYIEDYEEMTFDQTLAYWSKQGYTPTTEDIKLAGAGVILLKKLRLEEASICMRGANNRARVTGVKSMVSAIFQKLFGDASEGKSAGTLPEMQSDDVDAISAHVLKAIAPSIEAEIRRQVVAAKSQPKAIETAPAEHDAKPANEASSDLLAAELLLIDIEIEAALEEAI